MQKSNAENPEDLIVEGTELGEQWLGTRGLVAPAQEPAEVDPAKWGPGGIYPMSWLLLVLCLFIFEIEISFLLPYSKLSYSFLLYRPWAPWAFWAPWALGLAG